MDLLDQEVTAEFQEVLEKRETKELKVQLDPQEHPVLTDPEVPLVLLEQLVSQEREDNLDLSELLELLVKTVTLDQQDPKETPDPVDHKANVE